MRTLHQGSEGERPSESRGTGHSRRFPPHEQPPHETLNLTNVRHSPRLISGTNVTDEPVEATRQIWSRCAGSLRGRGPPAIRLGRSRPRSPSDSEPVRLSPA